MVKQIKLWKKQEKRIVKLLYKKGLLNNFKLKDLYWECFKRQKTPKRKNKSGYKFLRYFPEIHFGTVDYWGDGDEHSLVDYILDEMYWDNTIKGTEDGSGYPDSSFKYKSRKWFIKYLNSLPSKKFNNNINKILSNWS